MFGWFVARRLNRGLKKGLRSRPSAGNYDNYVIKVSLIFIAALAVMAITTVVVAHLVAG